MITHTPPTFLAMSSGALTAIIIGVAVPAFIIIIHLIRTKNAKR